MKIHTDLPAAKFANTLQHLQPWFNKHKYVRPEAYRNSKSTFPSRNSTGILLRCAALQRLATNWKKKIRCFREHENKYEKKQTWIRSNMVSAIVKDSCKNTASGKSNCKHLFKIGFIVKTVAVGVQIENFTIPVL